MNADDSNHAPGSTGDRPSTPLSLQASTTALGSVPDPPLVPSKVRKVLVDHEDRLGDTLAILGRLINQVGELEKDLKDQKKRLNSVWDATEKLHGDDPVLWSGKAFSGIIKGWAAFHWERSQARKQGKAEKQKAYTEEEVAKAQKERKDHIEELKRKRELADQLTDKILNGQGKRKISVADADSEEQPAHSKAKKALDI